MSIQEIAEIDVIKQYGSKIVIALLILIGVHIVSRILLKATDKYKEQLGTNYHVTFNVVRFLIYVTAVIGILQTFGFDVTSMITGLGVASVIVGFAFQDFLRDVFSGIGILYERFYNIGDIVAFNDIEGEVIGFTVRTTKIRSLKDDSTITICNREISSASILSHSFYLNLSLYYEEDVDKINEVLTNIVELIKTLPDIEYAEYLGASEFNDSSISYKIHYCGDPKFKYALNRSVIQLIQKELKKANISIAYNQLEINHRTTNS